MPPNNYRLRNMAKARRVWQAMPHEQRVRKKQGGQTAPKKQPTNLFPDPLAYYEAHCAGMTRGELTKYEPQLYYRLRRLGFLDAIPRRPSAAERRQKERMSPPLPKAAPPPASRNPTLASARLEYFRVIPE